jgi:hypothetical protein
MANVSRRAMLAAGGFAAVTTAARAAGVFGNPDLPPEGAVNVANPKALIDPGPQDPGLGGNEPSSLNPPATDVNGMPQFWASFNLAPKEFRTAAGHDRSPRTTSRSRPRSRACLRRRSRISRCTTSGFTRATSRLRHWKCSRRRLPPRPASSRVPSCSASPICRRTRRQRAGRCRLPIARTFSCRRRLRHHGLR